MPYMAVLRPAYRNRTRGGSLLPLKTRQQCVRALALGHKRQRPVFTHEEKNPCSLLISIAGMAWATSCAWGCYRAPVGEGWTHRLFAVRVAAMCEPTAAHTQEFARCCDLRVLGSHNSVRRNCVRSIHATRENARKLQQPAPFGDIVSASSTQPTCREVTTERQATE